MSIRRPESLRLLRSQVVPVRGLRRSPVPPGREFRSHGMPRFPRGAAPARAWGRPPPARRCARRAAGGEAALGAARCLPIGTSGWKPSGRCPSTSDHPAGGRGSVRSTSAGPRNHRVPTAQAGVSSTNYVRTLAALGADIPGSWSSTPGDHDFEPPSDAGAGSVSIVDVPWNDPHARKVASLLKATGLAARNNPRELGALVRTVGRHHGLRRRAEAALPPHADPRSPGRHRAPGLDQRGHELDRAPARDGCAGGGELPRLGPPASPAAGEEVPGPAAPRLRARRRGALRVGRAGRAGGVPRTRPLEGVRQRGGSTPACSARRRARRSPSRRRGPERDRCGWSAWVASTGSRVTTTPSKGGGARPGAGTEVEYTIIGRGDDRDRLSVLSAVRDLDLEDRVHLRGGGDTQEIRELREADVFLLSSLSEGLTQRGARGDGGRCAGGGHRRRRDA